MMKRLVYALIFSLTCLISTEMIFAQENTLPPACIPSNYLDVDWWKERHEANKARIEQGNVDLLLIGDSITHTWDREVGQKVQEYYYGDRNFINLGFGGDMTGNVLWRLNDLPLDKIEPKAAMLLIGINNLWVPCNQNPADVAQGTKMIVEKLESLYPNIKILVLFTFVVGENPDTPERFRVARENAAVLDLLRGDPHVILKDINYLWLDESNHIKKEMLGDFCHPTEDGCKAWGAAVEPEIAKMLGDTPKQPMK